MEIEWIKNTTIPVLDQAFVPSLLDFEATLFSIRNDAELTEQTRISYFFNNLPPVQKKLYDDLESLSSRVISEGNISTNMFLHDVVLKDYTVLVAMLVRCGANIHCTDNRMRGLLHKCVSRQMVKLLIKYGINLYQTSAGGHTALHNITFVDVANELIHLGLDPCSPSSSGSTPLHYVHNPHTARLFLKYGVNPNIVNYYGHSPLHVVASQGIWYCITVYLPHSTFTTMHLGRSLISSCLVAVMCLWWEEME